MRSLRSERSRTPEGLDMNIAFALSEDVISTRDHFGEHLVLDINLEIDHSVLTIRSHREGVIVCSEFDGPVYEAFPLAIRDAFYKWQEYKKKN
jgi:hypothetical protein